MTDVLIVGGGFAAVWAAAAAARRRYEAGAGPEELTISLLAPGADMVIRPRLYEERPGEMGVPLHRVLEPIGVRHVRASAEAVDVSRSRVTAVGAGGARITLHYGRLVIAAGSRLLRHDAFPGAERLHDIDTLPAAVALDEHLHRLPERSDDGRYTAVVIGAGFVGLELATELVGRLAAIAGGEAGVRVVLVERERHVGPELGSGPRPVIEDALDALGVERRLGTVVTGYDGRVVELASGERIPALTAVWTAGMRAAPIAERVPGPHDLLGRLEVDRHLRVTGLPFVFAAGDTAAIEVEPGRRALQACQYAHQTGKPAGHNAASDLLGLPPVAFEPDPYVTCLDLGGAGAVYTEGFRRRIQATGEAGKRIKRTINRELIYPPLDDAEAILLRADPGHEQRPPTPADYSSTLT
jgi:NADH:ubiquinone reductase (H+-translocating)